MGWRPCTYNEAQKFANNGIPTIGINEKNITIISPNEEKLLTNWESDGIITNNVSVLDGKNLSYYSTKPSDSFSNAYFSQNPLIVQVGWSGYKIRGAIFWCNKLIYMETK